MTADTDRFAALFDTHYHRILGYASRRGASDEAADVVAETFTIAWRRLDDVPTGDDALLWLYGVARRVLANQARSARRRARLATALAAEPRTTPQPRTDAPTYTAAAFGRLKEDERELLALIAWEGLGIAAIATVEGCSRNAVRIRLHRARRHFARELAALQLAALTGEPDCRPRLELGLED